MVMIEEYIPLFPHDMKMMKKHSFILQIRLILNKDHTK